MTIIGIYKIQVIFKRNETEKIKESVHNKNNILVKNNSSEKKYVM